MDNSYSDYLKIYILRWNSNKVRNKFPFFLYYIIWDERDFCSWSEFVTVPTFFIDFTARTFSIVCHAYNVVGWIPKYHFVYDFLNILLD